ncbi:MAG: GNAT family N-acetyltransferase [Pyrinomonadaceae bacterium]|nr:GNAT family N-acetyltransferase [Pyrinomonadaceae bacterium]
MKIRPADPIKDEEEIWEIFRRVIATGDTYVFDPDTSRQEFPALWFGEKMHTYVAETDEGIHGTYIMKPNQIGLGSHVANAGYMVHPGAQGMGIGTKMCEHSLIEAKRLGFRAMQFNIVVSTNVGAVRLWERFGFEIIGTSPGAFNHRTEGFVDAHIMYRKL